MADPSIRRVLYEELEEGEISNDEYENSSESDILRKDRQYYHVSYDGTPLEDRKSVHMQSESPRKTLELEPRQPKTNRFFTNDVVGSDLDQDECHSRKRKMLHISFMKRKQTKSPKDEPATSDTDAKFDELMEKCREIKRQLALLETEEVFKEEIPEVPEDVIKQEPVHQDADDLDEDLLRQNALASLLQPNTSAPTSYAHQQPTYQQSTHQQPTHQQPTHQQSTHHQPTHQKPTHQQSTNQQPSDYRPTRQQPIYQHISHHQPTQQKPSQQQSTYQPQTHQQSTHQQPTHQQSTHQQPIHQYSTHQLISYPLSSIQKTIPSQWSRYHPNTFAPKDEGDSKIRSRQRRSLDESNDANRIRRSSTDDSKSKLFIDSSVGRTQAQSLEDKSESVTLASVETSGRLNNSDGENYRAAISRPDQKCDSDFFHGFRSRQSRYSSERYNRSFSSANSKANVSLYGRATYKSSYGQTNHKSYSRNTSVSRSNRVADSSSRSSATSSQRPYNRSRNSASQNEKTSLHDTQSVHRRDVKTVEKSHRVTSTQDSSPTKHVAATQNVSTTQQVAATQNVATTQDIKKSQIEDILTMAGDPAEQIARFLKLLRHQQTDGTVMAGPSSSTTKNTDSGPAAIPDNYDPVEMELDSDPEPTNNAPQVSPLTIYDISQLAALQRNMMAQQSGYSSSGPVPIQPPTCLQHPPVSFTAPVPTTPPHPDDSTLPPLPPTAPPPAPPLPDGPHPEQTAEGLLQDDDDESELLLREILLKSLINKHKQTILQKSKSHDSSPAQSANRSPQPSATSAKQKKQPANKRQQPQAVPPNLTKKLRSHNSSPTQSANQPPQPTVASTKQKKQPIAKQPPPQVNPPKPTKHRVSPVIINLGGESSDDDNDPAAARTRRNDYTTLDAHLKHTPESTAPKAILPSEGLEEKQQIHIKDALPSVSCQPRKKSKPLLPRETVKNSPGLFEEYQGMVENCSEMVIYGRGAVENGQRMVEGGQKTVEDGRGIIEDNQETVKCEVAMAMDVDGGTQNNDDQNRLREDLGDWELQLADRWEAVERQRRSYRLVLSELSRYVLTQKEAESTAERLGQELILARRIAIIAKQKSSTVRTKARAMKARLETMSVEWKSLEDTVKRKRIRVHGVANSLDRVKVTEEEPCVGGRKDAIKDGSVEINSGVSISSLRQRNALLKKQKLLELQKAFENKIQQLKVAQSKSRLNANLGKNAPKDQPKKPIPQLDVIEVGSASEMDGEILHRKRRRSSLLEQNGNKKPSMATDNSVNMQGSCAPSEVKDVLPVSIGEFKKPSEKQMENLLKLQDEKMTKVLSSHCVDVATGRGQAPYASLLRHKQQTCEDSLWVRERSVPDTRLSRPFRPYTSPLLYLPSYRLCSYFRTRENRSLMSVTHTNAILPHKIFCRFSIQGACNDDSCPWQHESDYRLSDTDVLRDIVAYHPVIAGISSDETNENKIQQAISKYVDELQSQHRSMTTEELAVLLTSLVKDKSQTGRTQHVVTTKRAWRPGQTDKRDKLDAKKPKLPVIKPGRSTELSDISLKQRSSVSELDNILSETDARYFSGEDGASVMEMEAAILENPNDAHGWIKLAFKKWQEPTQLENVRLEHALNILARGLEQNKSCALLWRYYLRMYSHHPDSCHDYRDMCWTALGYVSDYLIWWQYLVSTKSCVDQIAVCKKILDSLKQRATQDNSFRVDGQGGAVNARMNETVQDVSRLQKLRGNLGSKNEKVASDGVSKGEECSGKRSFLNVDNGCNIEQIVLGDRSDNLKHDRGQVCDVKMENVENSDSVSGCNEDLKTERGGEAVKGIRENKESRSFHVVEVVLYMVSLHIQTGKYKTGLQLLGDTLSGKDGELTPLITMPHRCLMWLSYIHLSDHHHLPDSLYNPACQNPSRIVSIESFHLVRNTDRDVSKTSTSAYIALVRRAIKDIETHLATSPDRHDDIHTYLASLYQTLMQVKADHKPNEARNMYKVVLERYPHMVDIWLCAVAMEITNQCHDKAYQLIQAALSANRRSSKLHYYAANVYLTQGNYTAVRETLADFVKSLYTTLDDTQPNVNHLYLKLLDQSLPLRHDVTNLQCLLSPSSIQLELPYIWLNYCVLLEVQGEVTGAVEAYEMALSSLQCAADLAVVCSEYLRFARHHPKVCDDLPALISRCLGCLPIKQNVPHGDGASWDSYRHHNRILATVAESLDRRSRWRFFLKYTTKMAANIELVIRTCELALMDGDDHSALILATSVSYNQPANVTFWKMLIALSMKRGNVTQARKYYLSALQLLPHAFNLWKDYLLFEVTLGGSDEMTTWILEQCHSLGINMKGFLLILSH